MANPYTLPNIETHPADFLGPTALSMFVQALQTGFIVAQSVRFWERVDREPRWLWVLVLFVCAIACFQTGAAFASWWKIFVLNFGNWLFAIDPDWSQRIQSVMTVLMATPVQVFLIWRCWHVLNRSWVAITPMVLILLGSIIMSVVVTAQTFLFNFTAPLMPNAGPPGPVPISIPFVLSLVFPAVLDLIVTTTMLIFLLRSRSSVYTRRFRRVLTRLILVLWEAAVPPSACAITVLATYLTLVDKNFWDLAFQAILGKLYVISLLATLNARADLASAPLPTHFPTMTGSLGHMAWSSPSPLDEPIITSQFRASMNMGRSEPDRRSPRTIVEHSSHDPLRLVTEGSDEKV